MTLNKLVHGNSWLSVAAILLKLYPDQDECLTAYEEVYQKLLLMSPEESDLSIELEYLTDDFDGKNYVGVAGKYNNPKNEHETFSQAIEFEPWRKWLGMTVTKETISKFSELEIVAHCLFEMTFVGFDEETIQEELKKPEQEMEDYHNMSDEEKKENSISLDELFNKDEFNFEN